MTSVSNIHNRGDWIEWNVTVPAAGDYTVWCTSATT